MFRVPAPNLHPAPKLSTPLDVPADGLPNPRRAWAFFALALAMTMAVLDGAIVNIALPSMAAGFQVAPASAIWVANAYQLAIVVSLLPLASLGDSLGYRRVYISGLALFTLGSLTCALAPSLPALVAARVMQGFGAAGLMSVNAAIVRFIYPRAKLGQGVGNMAVVVACSSAAGPSVAAAILSIASWHWLFLINVPIGAAAFALALRVLPRTPRSGHRLDLVSVVFNAAMLALLITGVDRLGDRRDVAMAGIEIAGAAAVAGLLVWRQIGRPLPILPIDLLRMPVFALSMATSVASFAAQALGFIALPFYFEATLHRSATSTGLLMTPWPLAITLVAPFAGRLADRYQPGLLSMAGLLTLAFGLALMALAPSDPSAGDVAWRLAICGLGFGFFQAPNNRLILGSAPRERGGAASGLLSTGRLLGQSIGVALMAVIFARGLAQPTTVALWTASGLAAAGAVVSGLRRRE